MKKKTNNNAAFEGDSIKDEGFQKFMEVEVHQEHAHEESHRTTMQSIALPPLHQSMPPHSLAFERNEWHPLPFF